jgi:hypothetical protein
LVLNADQQNLRGQIPFMTLASLYDTTFVYTFPDPNETEPQAEQGNYSRIKILLLKGFGILQSLSHHTVLPSGTQSASPSRSKRSADGSNQSPAKRVSMFSDNERNAPPVLQSSSTNTIDSSTNINKTTADDDIHSDAGNPSHTLSPPPNSNVIRPSTYWLTIGYSPT